LIVLEVNTLEINVFSNAGPGTSSGQSLNSAITAYVSVSSALTCPEVITLSARVITCNGCNPVQWGAILAMILRNNLQFVVNCSSLWLNELRKDAEIRKFQNVIGSHP
jgi:hypothetical protein